MQTATLQELINFCESKKLGELAGGLKQELKTMRKSSATLKSSQKKIPNRENTQDPNDNAERRTLKLIRDAIRKDERKKAKEEVAKQVKEQGSSAGRPAPPKLDEENALNFNKEENEEIMEGLMNKIVVSPTFDNNEKLNAKIEKIMGVQCFNKMVENADVFQDISNTSLFNQSEFLQKSMNNAMHSFHKMLPSHSQMREDDEPDELPRFGATEENLHDQIILDPEMNEIDKSVEKLLGTAPVELEKKKKESLFAKEEDKNEEEGDQPSLPINDDSFSNLHMAEEPIKSGTDGGDKTPEGQPSLKMSMIHHNNDEGGDSFFQNQSSFVFGNDSNELNSQNPEGKDEYVDDDDVGFDTYVVNEDNFVASCRELASIHNFPTRAIKPDTQEYQQFREKKKAEMKAKEKQTLKKDDSAFMLKNLQKKKDQSKGEDEVKQGESPVKSEETKDKELDEDDGRKVSVLPRWIKFMPSNDEFYPAEFDNVIYDCYSLRVVFDREKTGFEETKDFPIIINSIVAGRYQVVEYLGSAAFSKAIQCYDIHTEQMVCMKIIENNKDYFDQSVDEIKLLRYINANCEDLDGKNLLKLIDFFYHKEHLFIVTELLRDNLYEYSKYNREVEKKMYFNVPRLQRITKQILNALSFIHDLKLIHCDLKPENILIKSYSRCEIKVIDFGSSCFIHDHLSSYVQSRSYRAPEVILGCRYDYKIDIWSLGCILAELFTGYVLFQNDSVQGLLSRVIGIIGPIPEYMMKEGRLVSNFFTREGLIYQEAGAEDENGVTSEEKEKRKKDKSVLSDEDLKINILVAKKTNLQKRMKCDDKHFVDFVRRLLEVDPLKRPTAKEALQHPWLTECQYEIE